MKLSETTFGSTPAAAYLARELNKLGDPILTKSISRRVVATKTHVASLVAAYQSGFLATKTLANTLRLMREEVSLLITDEFVYKLCKNVQIGAIKQALRLAHVARKAETRMADYKNKTTQLKELCVWHDFQRGVNYVAGRVIDGEVLPTIFTLDEVSDVTSEVLHERSMRRCERRGVDVSGNA